MGIGLELFDATGLSIFDTTSVVGRLIGVIDASATSGTATVPGLSQGIAFAIPQFQQTDVSGGAMVINNYSYPVCTFDGDNVSWTRQVKVGITQPSCMLILGVR